MSGKVAVGCGAGVKINPCCGCRNHELWEAPAAAADVARGGDAKHGMARTAGIERASSSAPSAVMGGGREEKRK